MRPVIWSDQAKSDLFDIADYIIQDNPFAADRVVDAIQETAKGLSDMPTGRPGRVKDTYEKLVTGLPYILAYAFHRSLSGQEIIYLLRVIHTSRDWKSGQWPHA